METKCYGMVRGSAIRVTAVDKAGRVPEPTPYAVSKAVAKVTINEVSEEASNEILSNPEETRRLRLTRRAQTIRYTVDVDFLRVDPGLLNLVAGVQLIRLRKTYREAGPFGFGEVGFGDSLFGEGVSARHNDFSEGFSDLPFGEGLFGGEINDIGQVIGFDYGTRTVAGGFGLEVWSKLANSTPINSGAAPFGEAAFGEDAFGGGDNPCREWGYTLFPYLKGGRISGFQFANGLVSFNLRGARTQKGTQWGVGPYDLERSYERLAAPVSRNTSFRTIITSAAPPVQVEGIQTLAPAFLDNGTAANPMPIPTALTSVDAGGAAAIGSTIDGGHAA